MTRRDNKVQYINEVHKAYDPLHYVLLFPNGDYGYEKNLSYDQLHSRKNSAKKLSILDYYSYRLMIKPNELNFLHRGGRLLLQYITDMYCKIETSRLNFFRFNQTKINALYSGIEVALLAKD